MPQRPDLPPRRGFAALCRTVAIAVVGILVACGGGGEAKSGLGGPDGYRPPPPLPPVDGIVPTALEGLTAWPGETGVVRLTFTAPADQGAIEAYEVRVSPAHLSPDPASPEKSVEPLWTITPMPLSSSLSIRCCVKSNWPSDTEGRCLKRSVLSLIMSFW